MVITKIYAIVPLADVDSNMISEVYQESLSSLRLSSGGDKAIVSWRGSLALCLHIPAIATVRF